MNRLAFSLFVAFGLILANALIPTADAQPYPNCPCTPTCTTSCTCCANNPLMEHTIPFTVYVAPNCVPPGITYYALPNVQVGNTLPNMTTAASISTTIPINPCPGQVCDTSTGLCCTQTTCTASACGTTIGTDNCGYPCNYAPITPCTCYPMEAYATAPVVANTSNTLYYAPWCYDTTGTIAVATSTPQPGCGTSGTPGTACQVTFTMSCGSQCSTCDVACTVCPVGQIYTAGCPGGQYIPGGSCPAGTMYAGGVC